MHYDDRLATVLRQSATGKRAARTQYRQLLDLLGRRKPVRGRSLAAEAWQCLDQLTEQLSPGERAAIVSDIGWHISSPELVANLANAEPAVAAAALERAKLSDDDWQTLIPRLPIRARGFLRLRRDLPPETERLLLQLGIHDRGLPNPDRASSAASPQAPVVTPAASPIIAPVAKKLPANDTEGDIAEAIPALPLGAGDEPLVTGGPDSDDSEIGALVKRIEAFQRARSSSAPDTQDPRLPLGDKSDHAERAPVAAFDFTCDASGHIDWASEEVAPMVEGAMLAGPDGLPLKALRNQRPFSAAEVLMQGAPAIADSWQVDASPRFSDSGGAFLGYIGRFRRVVEVEADPAQTPNSDAERIRQILHELRTPVNAIQGFAEAIQQQIFGPLPHEYRAHAAAIAGDSARMMAGFDEMDRLAKLESGALAIAAGESDFAGIVRGLTAQLNDVLSRRMAVFAETIPDTACPVALDKREAEAIAWRLLATVAGTASSGEEVELHLACQPESQPDMMQLRIAQTATLMAQDHIFASTAKNESGALSAGVFGAGFALRLVRAEAQAAGGMLQAEDDWLTLSLPHLTAANAQPSDGAIG